MYICIYIEKYKSYEYKNIVTIGPVLTLRDFGTLNYI